MNNIREKLVELIKATPIAEVDGRIANAEECLVSHVLESIADHLIANGVTVQEWFSVTEPPKENGRYYVHVKMHGISYVKIASFSKESVAGLHDNVWYDYDSDVGFYEVRDVTHWMHLPTPPKGGVL